MRLPLNGAASLALSLLCIVSLPSAATAAGGLRLSAQLGLGSGYDSNAFLEASALPAALALAEAGGPLLRVTPELTFGWAPTLGQELLVGYAAQLDQFLAGDVGRETALRHGPQLAYLPPGFAGFDLLLQGGLQQLVFRSAEVGWLQAFGRVRLGRSLREGLWLAVAYLLGQMAYEAGAAGTTSVSAVQSEWTHALEATLRWRVAPTFEVELGYTLTRVLAHPRSVFDPLTQQTVVPPDDAFDAWRQGGGLTLRWRPWPRASLEATYRFWWVGFDARPGPRGPLAGPPPTVPTQTLLHEAAAVVRWDLWGPVGLWVSYGATLGSTQYYGPAGSGAGMVTSSGSYARHVVVAGLLVRFGWRRLASAARRADDEPHAGGTAGGTAGVLALRVRAPGARQVAVIGTFNGWDRERGWLRRRGERWERDVPLPPGEHRYVLWVDGAVRPPPGCRAWVPDGFGGRNCAVSSGSAVGLVSNGLLGRKEE